MRSVRKFFEKSLHKNINFNMLQEYLNLILGAKNSRMRNFCLKNFITVQYIINRPKAPISFFSSLGWGYPPQAPTYVFSYKEKT